MLNNDCQALFDTFIPMAREYLRNPGVMAALELDKLCMQLYPTIAREKGDMALSNSIREFGRGLPRKDADELQTLLEQILLQAEAAGLQTKGD